MAVTPLERLFHEDKILSDRGAAYLAANAFLVLGFVTVISSSVAKTSTGVIIESSIVAVGVVLAWFFTAIGIRTVTAIEFWRECEHGGAKQAEDLWLFNFFHDRDVLLGNGVRIVGVQHPCPKPKKEGSVRAAVPWRWEWISSLNNVVGVILPVIIAGFWVVASFTIYWGRSVSLGGRAFPWFLQGLVIFVLASFFFGWLWKTRPWTPRHEGEPTLLAVLGRGVQQTSSGWVPTPAYEMCELLDGKPRHRRIPVEVVKDAEECRVGGGQLNVRAAAHIIKRARMQCVLGFASPASYLRDSEGKPSVRTEGDPMAAYLRTLVDRPEVIDWKADLPGLPSTDSDTAVEVANVMDCARDRGIRNVLFVTISAHVPRVILRARQESRTGETFTVLASETILAEFEPSETAELADLQASAPYQRTIRDELYGTAEALGLKVSSASSPTASPRGPPTTGSKD